MKSLSNKTMLTFMFAIAFLTGFYAHAQETVTDMDFITQVFGFINGYKGLTGLALAAAVVQLIMFFLKAPLSNFVVKAGATKITIVSLLSLIAGIIALKQAGLSTAEAALHSSTLAALQVFANQIYKQFFEKKS